jgi:predicted oxidoreductase
MLAAVHPRDEPVTAIIVGAGFAGLSAAIECTLRGLKVIVYESTKQLTAVGALIPLAPSPIQAQVVLIRPSNILIKQETWSISPRTRPESWVDGGTRRRKCAASIAS